MSNASKVAVTARLAVNGKSPSSVGALDIPAASANNLGLVKVGENLTLAADGTISVPVQSGGSGVVGVNGVIMYPSDFPPVFTDENNATWLRGDGYAFTPNNPADFADVTTRSVCGYYVKNDATADTVKFIGNYGLKKDKKSDTTLMATKDRGLTWYQTTVPVGYKFCVNFEDSDSFLIRSTDGTSYFFTTDFVNFISIADTSIGLQAKQGVASVNSSAVATISPGIHKAVKINNVYYLFWGFSYIAYTYTPPGYSISSDASYSVFGCSKSSDGITWTTQEFFRGNHNSPSYLTHVAECYTAKDKVFFVNSGTPKVMDSLGTFNTITADVPLVGSVTNGQNSYMSNYYNFPITYSSVTGKYYWKTLVSSDGINFTTSGTLIRYVVNNKIFCSDGTVTDDEITYTPTPLTATGLSVFNVCFPVSYSQGLYCCIVQNFVYTSTDCVNWTQGSYLAGSPATFGQIRTTKSGILFTSGTVGVPTATSNVDMSWDGGLTWMTVSSKGSIIPALFSKARLELEFNGYISITLYGSVGQMVYKVSELLEGKNYASFCFNPSPISIGPMVPYIRLK